MIMPENFDVFIESRYPNVLKVYVDEDGKEYTKDLSRLRMIVALKKLAEFEKELDKSFEQFTQTDFIRLFEQSNWTALNTFISNKSLVKEFAEWYFENIIGLNNIPFGYPKISAIEHIELEDVSSEFRYKKEYFKDYNDFMGCIEELYGTSGNDQFIMQQVFFALMWEGINRNELKGIKKDDVECPPDEIKAIIHLHDRDVAVTEEMTVKIIRQAVGAIGYDVVQKNGRGRAYQFANTDMLLRNTSKVPVGRYSMISESSINNFYTDQARRSDELPCKSPYHGKRLVFRGISDSGAFYRLIFDGEINRVSKEQIARARQVNAVISSITESFNFNYQGWKKYFGYK